MSSDKATFLKMEGQTYQVWLRSTRVGVIEYLIHDGGIILAVSAAALSELHLSLNATALTSRVVFFSFQEPVC